MIHSRLKDCTISEEICKGKKTKTKIIRNCCCKNSTPYLQYLVSSYSRSLTKLSSLTFLTPMFASIFGFLYLGETFSPLQLGGAMITIVGIYLVNYKTIVE